MIFIEPSLIADFKMRIFNSDGTEAEMCGNGIRCFAKYVYENKMTNKKNLKIETLAGIKDVTIIENNNQIQEISVNMGRPKILEEIKLKILDKDFEIIKVSMGNPHAIIFINNVDEFEVEKYGPIIENNKHFPLRTNVEFVEILDKNLIKLRVWERGAKETFACGTGSCAAVAAGIFKGMLKETTKVILKGGELKINWDGKMKSMFMEGIANKVFDGRIYIK